MHRIYMDHAATTAVDPEVIEAMLPYFEESFGNASSLHSLGQEARKALESARAEVASIMGAKDNEIIFTAGGTESDNIAIKGIAYHNKKKGKHIITSKIEHPAVLSTCKYLEGQGYDISYLPVDKYGLLDTGDVENAIKDNTILITIMHANNEIGTIEDIGEIGRIARKHNIPFHTDAVQSTGKVPIDVDKMNVDMLSISSHKIYGPKGVGALYIRNGIRLEPLVHGGGHENGLRSSTENIPGIAGFGKACSLAKTQIETEMQRLTKLRDTLIDNILHNIEESYLNGHRTKRLPNNVSLRFNAIEGESLVLSLDSKGIAASTGSACSSKKLEPSHVLMAIGLNEVEAHGSLRLTLGRWNTEEEVEYVCEVLPQVVERLRRMSPLWGKKKK